MASRERGVAGRPPAGRSAHAAPGAQFGNPPRISVPHPGPGPQHSIPSPPAAPPLRPALAHLQRCVCSVAHCLGAGRAHSLDINDQATEDRAVIGCTDVLGPGPGRVTGLQRGGWACAAAVGLRAWTLRLLQAVWRSSTRHLSFALPPPPLAHALPLGAGRPAAAAAAAAGAEPF